MTKTKTHLYEGMYILSATLSEDARNKALERIINGITSRGGEIKKSFDQGRKKLAYQINKRREGHYYVLFFQIEPSFMKEMWEEYHLNEDLVRFMNLQVDLIPESLEFKPLIEQQ
ncbi:MAG: 30S ribosomal protein S6 [Chlamydiales bacterium]|nr:30S ribosomal protein S6 [Chlamydiales bacterium]